MKNEDFLDIARNQNNPKILEDAYYIFKARDYDRNEYINTCKSRLIKYIEEAFIQNANTPIKVLKDIGYFAHDALINRAFKNLENLQQHEKIELLTKSTEDYIYESLVLCKNYEIFSHLARHRFVSSTALFKLSQKLIEMKSQESSIYENILNNSNVDESTVIYISNNCKNSETVRLANKKLFFILKIKHQELISHQITSKRLSYVFYASVPIACLMMAIIVSIFH